MKECSKCKVEKLESFFGKEKRVKSGLQAQCKECRKSYGQYYTKEQSSEYNIEHKTPLSRGGSNLKENICLSCPKCNFEKGSKTEMEYYKYLKSEGFSFDKNLE